MREGAALAQGLSMTSVLLPRLCKPPALGAGRAGAPGQPGTFSGRGHISQHGFVPVTVKKQEVVSSEN